MLGAILEADGMLGQSETQFISNGHGLILWLGTLGIRDDQVNAAASAGCAEFSQQLVTRMVD